MPYRQIPDERAARGERERGALLRVSADGRAGVDALNGKGGADGRGDGAHGSPGKHAGEAGQGEDAGSIVVVLRSDRTVETSLTLTGRAFTNGQGEQTLEEPVDFGRAGEIELVALGGKGGDGGHGGRGGEGARGHAGRDATRYSSGGDGGPGGNGGSGGKGSSGGPGGRGGDVVVQIADEDTALLMLVAHNVGGGKGGEAGKNGEGGLGGAGGPGGDSYTWTETHSTTDSDGRSSTQTTTHRNSGGSRGRSGIDGPAGKAVLKRGASGDDGAFTIEVVGSDGDTRRYPSRYDLRLVAFEHHNDNDDGVYEPEEKIRVSRVEVENVGGMPLPAHHDVIVSVVDDGWIAPVAEQHLTLPRALPPGARHVFDRDALDLHLRMFRPQQTGPALAAPETIRLRADLPRARRQFGAFETPESKPLGNIVIRFPVEISPPSALFSLAPGQATRVRWTIENVAEKAFGLESTIGRAVAVRLYQEGGELGAEEIHLFDRDGKRHLLDGSYAVDVPRIDARGKIAFEAVIAMAEDAPAYASARLVVCAELGQIDDPSRVRAIQLQEVTVRVGKPFDAKDADVLLLVHNRTSAEELAAWEGAVAAAGLSSAVWDVSLEGGVSILEEILRGGRRYRLAIALNHEHDTPKGALRTSALVAKETSHALAARGTHVMYAGPTVDLEPLLLSTTASPKLPQETPNATDIVIAAEGLSIGGEGFSVDVYARLFLPNSTASPVMLQRAAVRLQERLHREAPERRFVVTQRYAPADPTSRWPFRRVYVGTLEVRRTLDAAPGAIGTVAIDVTRGDERALSFIRSDAMLAATLTTLPFEGKIALLSSSPLPYGARRSGAGGEHACEDAIVAAVLGDLLAEQGALLHHRGRLRLEAFERATVMLRHLVSAAPNAVTPGGDAARRVIELSAWLELCARGHTRFWHWLPPLPWLARAPQVRHAVLTAVQAIIARAFPDEGAAREANAAIRARQERIKALLDEVRRADGHKRRTAATFALETLAEALEDCPPARDNGVLDHHERIVSSDRHDAVARSDKRARTGIARASESGAAARAELLVAEPCAALLTRAGHVRGTTRIGAMKDHDAGGAPRAADSSWAQRPSDDDDAAATGDDLSALLEPRKATRPL